MFFCMVSVLLDDFVPEGGFLRDEVAGHEVVVDAQTGPGVDGGIALLGFGELRGLPVGELLALADFLVKNDGVDLLQAHVGDMVLLDHLLEFDEGSGLHVADAGELVEVVVGRQSHLGDGFVLEVLLEWGGDACPVDAEEESVVLVG